MVHKVIVTEKRWNSYSADNAPCGRYGHRVIAYRDRMILHGGYNGSTRLNDTFEFHLEKKIWREIQPQDDVKPTERDCHSAVLYNHYMIIFGGGDGFHWLNDVWQFDVISETWSKIECSGDAPPGRAGHSANIWKNKMYIFAGWNGRRTLNDMYELCLRTFVWRRVETKGGIPSSRDSHTTNIVSDTMIVVGGGDGKSRLNDMHRYNLKTETWDRLECIGEAEAGRAGHVSIIFDDRLFVFGGGDGSNWLNDVYECNIKAPKWSLIEHTTDSSSSIAPGCYGLSAVAYENQMIIFGGGDGKKWYNNIYTYKLGDHKRKRYTMDMLSLQLVRQAFSDVDFVFAADLPYEMVPPENSTTRISKTQEPSISANTVQKSTSTCQELLAADHYDDDDEAISSHMVSAVYYGAYEEYLAMREDSLDSNQID